MPIVKATTGIHLSRRFASVVSLLTSKVSLLNCPCFAPLIAIHACDAMAFVSVERAGPAGAAVKSYAGLADRIGRNPIGFVLPKHAAGIPMRPGSGSAARHAVHSSSISPSTGHERPT